MIEFDGVKRVDLGAVVTLRPGVTSEDPIDADNQGGSGAREIGAPAAIVRGRRLHPSHVLDSFNTGDRRVRQDVSAGVRWLGFSQVASQVIKIGMVLVLTRLLTPTEFGVVTLVMVVTGLFERVLGDTGTVAALIRHPELRHDLASSVFWWNVAIGVATTAVFAAAGKPIAYLLGDPDVANLVRVAGVAALIGSLGHVQRALLRRMRQFRALAAVNLMNALATAVATIAMAVAGWGAWALVAGNLVGSAISLALAWALSAWRPAFHYSRAAIRQISGFSVNLTIQNVFGYFSYAGDRFIIGRFIGTTELGYYGLANRLLRYPLQTSAQTYREVVTPTLARIQNDHESMAAAYRRTLGGIAMVLVPLCLSVTALADNMVPALLGPKWAPAAGVVAIMSLVAALQALTTTTGSLYVAKGRSDLSLRWQMVASVVLMICYTAGAFWGVEGVAWGFFVGVAVLTYPAFRIPLALIDTRPSYVLKPLLPTVLAAGLAAAAGRGVSTFVEGSTDGPWPPLLAGCATVAAIYGAYLLIARPAALRDLIDSLTNRRRRRRPAATA